VKGLTSDERSQAAMARPNPSKVFSALSFAQAFAPRTFLTSAA
jgi:hypothetical protein